MTITVTGVADVQRYIRDAEARLKKVLEGAGRAGGRVIAEEAKPNAPADETRRAITVKVDLRDDHVRVMIDVKRGWGRALAIWAEFGTTGHYISVDAEQSGGRTARRVNNLAIQNVLVINGQPVGKTVWHPGARQMPFLRPALDLHRADAIRAAQVYIDMHVKRGLIAIGSGEV